MFFHLFSINIYFLLRLLCFTLLFILVINLIKNEGPMIARGENTIYGKKAITNQVFLKNKIFFYLKYN